MIRKNDWTFYRKGEIDQARHKKKIKQAIKENLSDLIGEEVFFKEGQKQKISVNIKSLNEYKITFGDGKDQGVGMGKGKPKEGETFQKGEEEGMGMGAGEQAGNDWYESEIDLEEIKEEIFSELELPELSEKKQKDRMMVVDVEYSDVRRKGIEANIHKKRTILNSMKNGANPMTHKPKIQNQDVVYKTWKDVEKPESNAVIFALMDTSGSMGIWEKNMSRTFYYWTKKFLETKYDNVEIIYIGHHTEAKVQTEEEFFTKGESGGTICSSAYRKMTEIMNDKYPPEKYNIYGFHVSDGDNLTSDNARCVKFIQELTKEVVTFNYLEVNQYNRHSTLNAAYQNIDIDNFKRFIANNKEAILKALKTFFPKKKD